MAYNFTMTDLSIYSDNDAALPAAFPAAHFTSHTVNTFIMLQALV